MQSIPFHIAYLLTRHECVIVPDLGAFIVSPSDREKVNRWGVLFPPENVLEFSPEIKHNDGLLADSIVKEKNISYDEANLLITQYITYILHSLDEGEKVQIPGVGTLYSEDNKQLFQPDKTLSCNAFNYGLTGFSLPYLNDLQQEASIISEQKNKKFVLTSGTRKFIIYTCSIAAAILAICIIPTPLNNNQFSTVHTQYASITGSLMQNEAAEETNTLEPEIQMQTDSTEIQFEEIPMQQPDEISLVRVTQLHYYMIVADSPDEISAKKILGELKSKGFENAAILRTDERYRIYTNHFENKNDAESFLTRFKKDYPEYSRAWLLSSLPPSQFE